MTPEPCRFKKSSYSNNSSDCVEVAATLDRVRDSKNPAAVLSLPNLAQFLREVKER
jgi:hypothetical protein